MRARKVGTRVLLYPEDWVGLETYLIAKEDVTRHSWKIEL